MSAILHISSTKQSTIMKPLHFFVIVSFAFFFSSCSSDELDEKKGFQVSPTSENENEDPIDGFNRDSLGMFTKPSGVLLTGVSNVRLTPIYKVNINESDNTTFIGSTRFHESYENDDSDKTNNWNNNIIPGFEAAYGFNLVNVSHYDVTENTQKYFFEKPALIRTLYYPTFSKDTLNNIPVQRAFFMASVYNDDTNKDGFINLKDLRRFYLFNIHGEKQSALVPENYAVFKSEYDSANDFMYVFAQLDSNNNGQQDASEPIHIFWIDLKDPSKTGRVL